MIHHLDEEDAMRHGVNAAFILNLLRGWIRHNHFNANNRHDGRTWTFNSVAAWQRDLPFLTRKQIRSALDHLVEEGVLLKGNYAKNKLNRASWYAFNDESFLKKNQYAPQGDSEEKGFAPQVNPISPNGQMLSNNLNNTSSIDNNACAREEDPPEEIEEALRQTGRKVVVMHLQQEILPPPSGVQEVIEFGATVGIPPDVCTEFYWHYAGQGWMTGTHLPVANWKAKLNKWNTKHKSDQRQRINGNSSTQRTTKQSRIDLETAARESAERRAAGREFVGMVLDSLGTASNPAGHLDGHGSSDQHSP